MAQKPKPAEGPGIVLNPYLSALRTQFEKATRPVSGGGKGAARPDGRIVLGEIYRCRRWMALARKSPVQPSGDSSLIYEFRAYGELFHDNLAFLEYGGVRTFAAHPGLDDEWMGQDQLRGYLEAIRVNERGDLLIEAWASKSAWASSVLGPLGMAGSSDRVSTSVSGLALPSVVARAEGWVVSYAYCPSLAPPAAPEVQGPPES